MVDLNELNCESCQSDLSRMTEIEVAELLTQITEWHITYIDGISALDRCGVFNNYQDALAFIIKVGGLADAQ